MTLRATSSKTVQTRKHHAFSRIMQDNSSFHTLKTYLVIKETQCDTVFCMQFFNARNCFKHISHSTSGTFAATQPPYSFACKELIFYFFKIIINQRQHSADFKKVIPCHVAKTNLGSTIH